MRHHEVLAELRELKKEWRRNNLTFTNPQKARYKELMVLRRARVAEMQEK